MGGLNVHADDQSSATNRQKKKWYKSPKIIIGVAALVAVPVIGTTLATPAGNITVNTDGNVTFGQGEAGVLPCDSSVIIHPHQAYVDGWFLDKVTITDFNLNTTSEGTGCGGADIVLHATSGLNTTPVAGGTVEFSCTSSGTETDNPDYSNHEWGPTVVCTPGDPLTTSTVTITWASDPAADHISGFAISQG
jgi:hypothetical protein